MRARRLRPSWVLSFFFLFCAADGISASQAPLVPPQPDDSILLLPASPQELGDRQQALRRVKERLRDDRDQPRRDLLVVFTDESGQAILPRIPGPLTTSRF
jgi:hypothetical protein